LIYLFIHYMMKALVPSLRAERSSSLSLLLLPQISSASLMAPTLLLLIVLPRGAPCIFFIFPLSDPLAAVT
jgi:hypothetical protein